jgi:hypothetical protein
MIVSVLTVIPIILIISCVDLRFGEMEVGITATYRYPKTMRMGRMLM